MLINDFLILVAKVQHYLHKKCRNYHFFGTNRLLSETIATKRMNKQVGSALWGNEHAKVLFFFDMGKKCKFLGGLHFLVCSLLFYDVFDEADSDAVQAGCFGVWIDSTFLEPEFASGDRRILGFAPQIV